MVKARAKHALIVGSNPTRISIIKTPISNLKMENFLISCAYVYPLCPLSINHAKMFVVADVIARNEKAKGKNVFFPIASHYSGNSVQKISKIINKNFSPGGQMVDDEKKLFLLYRDFYKTPTLKLKTFVDPLNILEFYNGQILWELKSLGVSCNYENFYTTAHEDFSIFVNTIISLYENNNLLVRNSKGDLALDYNNEKWKIRMLDLINRTEFTQSFHKNNVISALKDVRNDWSLLKKNGYGVKYKKWIIDPMFDSEIFTIFDLYIKFTKNHNRPNDVPRFFADLFTVLQTGNQSENSLINKIIGCLPCDVLICEEHLKNWIVKKIFAESLLLHKKYQTKKYFILGMGFLDNKQMSASKGSAILVKDLIDKHGPIMARLIILLSGGHPSKMFNFDLSSVNQARRLLNDFAKHYQHLLSIASQEPDLKKTESEGFLKAISKNIEDNLEKTYFRQAVIELLSILPKTFHRAPSPESARNLLFIYNKYIEILLPGLLNKFKNI